MKQMLVVSSLLIMIAGCDRSEPTSYEVPKESPAPAPVQSPHPTMGSMGSMGAVSDMEAVQAAHVSLMADTKQTAFQAELPEGWSEKPASGMRMANYAIGDTSIDFYLISLSVGDLTSNVNRWRGQAGLPDISADEIAPQVEHFQVDGHAVNYIEIYNEEGGKGIIAAIVDLAPVYWYFTAKGPVAELKANAADIRSFVGSLKFQ